jgi:hypothetical protein
MENNKRKLDIDTFEENVLSNVSRVRKRRIRPTSPEVSQLQKEREEREREREEREEREREREEREREREEREREREEIDLYCDENFDKKNVFVSLPPMCHCVECFAYMGEMNPRQYCCKTHCTYSDFEPSELLAMQVYHLRTSPYYYDPTFIYYSEYHNEIQNFITKNYISSTDVQSQSLDGIGDSDDQVQSFLI